MRRAVVALAGAAGLFVLAACEPDASVSPNGQTAVVRFDKAHALSNYNLDEVQAVGFCHDLFIARSPWYGFTQWSPDTVTLTADCSVHGGVNTPSYEER